MRLLVILQLIRPGKLLCAHITFIREPIVNDQRVFSQLVLSHGLVATLGAGIANLLVDALHVLLEPVLAGRGEGAEVARVADAQVDGVAMVGQLVFTHRREITNVTSEPKIEIINISAFFRFFFKFSMIIVSGLKRMRIKSPPTLKKKFYLGLKLYKRKDCGKKYT